MAPGQDHQTEQTQDVDPSVTTRAEEVEKQEMANAGKSGRPMQTAITAVKTRLAAMQTHGVS